MKTSIKAGIILSIVMLFAGCFGSAQKTGMQHKNNATGDGDGSGSAVDPNGIATSPS